MLLALPMFVVDVIRSAKIINLKQITTLSNNTAYTERM